METLLQQLEQLEEVSTLITALLTLFAGLPIYFGFQSRRDALVAAANSFEDVVDNLAADSETKQLAAAILLRRFFDPASEQGGRPLLRLPRAVRPWVPSLLKKRLPYAKEAISVTAAMLRREDILETVRTVLADGLRWAPSLRFADLRECNLENAYLGRRSDSGRPDLAGAELFEARLARASLRQAHAVRAVFYGADVTRTVFDEANLRRADFRGCQGAGARFRGAKLHHALFDDADLASADFRGARLTGVDFTRTRELEGAKFSSASFALPDGYGFERAAQGAYQVVTRTSPPS